MKPLSLFAPAVSITGGSRHHFFGYYDKSCWDSSERWILGLETSFRDHPPRPGDVATIGLIDTHCGNEWTPLAESTAWNWQQGCMLQWLGETRKIIFNDCRGGKFIARILDTETKAEYTLERPVYGVNSTGTHAISVNFSRLHHQRPGYGYAGVEDPWREVLTPENDGIYAVDLQTGESRMIHSIASVAGFLPQPEFVGKMHRFNHLQFAKAGNRFAMLHRYKTPDEEVGHTRLLTSDIDGSNLRVLSDHGFVSHYDWLGQEAVLAWSGRRGWGDHYYLYQDDQSRIDVIGKDCFNSDGHCSFSPDGKWMLTDSYPDESDRRALILFHISSGERVDIGRFLSPPVEWQIRCDLHPRWSRNGKKVCFDSVHEGTRQMYVIDVSDIVDPA